jgi:hypothetical protein
MALSRKEAEHVFQALRGGTVPERGIEAFAVGIDPQRRELTRMLSLVSEGNGEVKFLRGGYGCGKTFMSNLAMHDAKAKNFVTSFVVVSDNDLHFHKFDELYRKVVQGLSTTACPKGALGDILDRWIGRIEEDLIQLGSDEKASGFGGQVRAKLDEKLALLTGGRAPADMVRVVGAIFDLKEEGKLTEATALLSWLSGSTNVAQSEKKVAGIRGDIGSTDAMAYLRGILEIIKSAGYAGLVIVIDEAETILRMKSDVRQKSLNGIRQIVDDAKNYPGLLWLFTGTPTFFDDRRGVKGLEALNDRIAFDEGGGFPNLRQPQLALKPFDRARLIQVALKLRGLHPNADADQLEARVHNGVVEKLAENVTAGFKGDVGVVPRHFLRQFVNMLDQCVEYEEYDPAEHVGFAPVGLSAQEERAMKGEPEAPADDEATGFGGAEIDT